MSDEQDVDEAEAPVRLSATNQAFYDSMVELIREHDDRDSIESMRRAIIAIHESGEHDDPLAVRVRAQQISIIDQALADTE